MSRQRDWQRKKQREGKCTSCGNARDGLSIVYCTACQVRHRASNRKAKGCKPWVDGSRGRVPLERREARHAG